MTKLSFGKSTEISNSTKCDFCGEQNKRCARTIFKYFTRGMGEMAKVIKDYRIEWVGFLSSKFLKVIDNVEYKFLAGEPKSAEQPFDVCGDCASQIAKEINPKALKGDD